MTSVRCGRPCRRISEAPVTYFGCPTSLVRGERHLSPGRIYNATWYRSVSSKGTCTAFERPPVRSLTSLYQEHGVGKGEQTRQEIIRKAAPIFNQKGYSGTALSDLMRATGLGKGGIYRHFESKQEL